jgi:NADH-quinone oxidoreductase subunit L
LVFFGDSHIPPERYKKVHESPTSMIMPMTILAFLAMIGGFIGVPEVLGGTNIIWRWLSPLLAFVLRQASTEAGTAAETILMVITLLWSLHFMVMGWVIYSQKRDLPLVLIRRIRFVHRFVANKYYIDELYNLLFVRPLLWISEKVLWRTVDDLYIDGLAITGSARSLGFWGSVLSLMQNGKVQQYLLYFLIGAVVIIGYMAL